MSYLYLQDSVPTYLVADVADIITSAPIHTTKATFIVREIFILIWRT